MTCATALCLDYSRTITACDICPTLGQRPVSPDAAATLRILHGLGLPLALISNTKPGQCRRQALRAAGVLPLFSAVIESEKIGVEKPDPAFYHLAADALGLPACRIATVGDNLINDVIAPLACGFGVAFLIRPDGMLRHGEVPPERSFVIESISRLPDLFRRS
ncbi:HAD family hydrolase [Nonomuraea fuscirosea]